MDIWRVKNMSDNYNNQEENKIKAIAAFNEFMDCFIKADCTYKDAIGYNVLGMMLAKSNMDEQFNNYLGYALDIIKIIGKLKSQNNNI